jgi:hypothetical protein
MVAPLVALGFGLVTAMINLYNVTKQEKIK